MRAIAPARPPEARAGLPRSETKTTAAHKSAIKARFMPTRVRGALPYAPLKTPPVHRTLAEIFDAVVFEARPNLRERLMQPSA